MQMFVHQFLGWNIWQNSTRPFFSFDLQWNWKGKSKFVYFGLVKSIWNMWVRIKIRDKDEISIWNILMWIKWETKFLNSYVPLSIGLNP